LRIKTGFFIFLLSAQKKNETKRKSAGCRSGAKNRVNFLNKKNSLTLKQLFVLHGNSPDFLYAPPLNAGPPTFSNGGIKCALLFEVSTHRNKRSNVASWIGLTFLP